MSGRAVEDCDQGSGACSLVYILHCAVSQMHVLGLLCPPYDSCLKQQTWHRVITHLVLEASAKSRRAELIAYSASQLWETDIAQQY